MHRSGFNHQTSFIGDFVESFLLFVDRRAGIAVRLRQQGREAGCADGAARRAGLEAAAGQQRSAAATHRAVRHRMAALAGQSSGGSLAAGRPPLRRPLDRSRSRCGRDPQPRGFRGAAEAAGNRPRAPDTGQPAELRPVSPAARAGHRGAPLSRLHAADQSSRRRADRRPARRGAAVRDHARLRELDSPDPQHRCPGRPDHRAAARRPCRRPS